MTTNSPTAPPTTGQAEMPPWPPAWSAASLDDATFLTTPATSPATDDPFAGLDDEQPAQPADVREHYLDRARRGYAALHRSWVQRPRGTAGSRASMLAEFVTNRRETALEAFLLLHSLQPVLQLGQPLAMNVWATMLTRTTKVSDTSATKAFAALEGMKLVTRSRDGRASVVEPLAEDGSGSPWTPPGTRSDRHGYFTLPFAYWLDGYADRLHLAGKAMLMILLSATQGTTAADIPIDRAKEWYGVSERTAERGYHELDEAGLLLVRRQQKRNPEVRGGWYHAYHRALRAPFSTVARRELQSTADAARRARRGSADTSGEKGGDDQGDTTSTAART